MDYKYGPILLFLTVAGRVVDGKPTAVGIPSKCGMYFIVTSAIAGYFTGFYRVPGARKSIRLLLAKEMKMDFWCSIQPVSEHIHILMCLSTGSMADTFIPDYYREPFIKAKVRLHCRELQTKDPSDISCHGMKMLIIVMIYDTTFNDLTYSKKRLGADDKSNGENSIMQHAHTPTPTHPGSTRKANNMASTSH
ncbi:hypothetical protein V8E54_007624 [Elaphomyces granulatus]